MAWVILFYNFSSEDFLNLLHSYTQAKSKAGKKRRPPCYFITELVYERSKKCCCILGRVQQSAVRLVLNLKDFKSNVYPKSTQILGRDLQVQLHFEHSRRIFELISE